LSKRALGTHGLLRRVRSAQNGPVESLPLQRMPLGPGARLRAAASGRIQLGHRRPMAARDRSGKNERGRGALRVWDTRTYRCRAHTPPPGPPRRRVGTRPPGRRQRLAALPRALRRAVRATGSFTSNSHCFQVPSSAWKDRVHDERPTPTDQTVPVSADVRGFRT
jgi:hypothetical protein